MALVEIGLALIVPSIIGLVRLFMNHAVLKSKHDSLQNEVDQLKIDIKEQNRETQNHFDKRFEKLENLIEKYFTWTRENQK